MTPEPPTTATPRLTAERFEELIREGQELRRAFDRHSAPMRQLTADDLARRSR
jgi:hypothetical protein